MLNALLLLLCAFRGASQQRKFFSAWTKVKQKAGIFLAKKGNVLGKVP